MQEVSDNGWGELSITYANAPGFGPVLGASGPTTGGTYSEIDVTGNGSFSFALPPLNNTNLRAGDPRKLQPTRTHHRKRLTTSHTWSWAVRGD